MNDLNWLADKILDISKNQTKIIQLLTDELCKIKEEIEKLKEVKSK